MEPVKFKQANVTYAEYQPEYRPLPAYRADDGEVVSCWKLNLRERLTLLFSGTLWLRMLTFNKALQPILPQIEKPFLD